MNEIAGYFITWTTYGTWLPGDARGWRKRMARKPVQPTALAADHVGGDTDRPEASAYGSNSLDPQRTSGGPSEGTANRGRPKANAYGSFCGSGGPQLPRPNLERWCREQMSGDPVVLRPLDRATVEDAVRKHCKHRGWDLTAVNARTKHVHVVVVANAPPKKVRDQLKANCTASLRRQVDPLNAENTWSKGGDIEILQTDEELYQATLYVLEGQDFGSPTELEARPGGDGETDEPEACASGDVEPQRASGGPGDGTAGCVRPEASAYGSEDGEPQGASRGPGDGAVGESE